MHIIVNSGGASGEARWGLCPGCKPLCPGRQAVVISFMQHHFLAFRSTIFHTNRGQLFVGHGKGNYQKVSGVTLPDTFNYWRGLPHVVTCTTQCPSNNKLLVPPLIVK